MREFIELFGHHCFTFKDTGAIGLTCVEWKVSMMSLKYHGMSAQKVLFFHLFVEDSYAAYLNKLHHYEFLMR